MRDTIVRDIPEFCVAFAALPLRYEQIKTCRAVSQPKQTHRTRILNICHGPAPLSRIHIITYLYNKLGASKRRENLYKS